MDIDQNLRQSLLKLSKAKEIPYTPTKIRKMSQSELEQVYAEHLQNELETVNETFANIIIVKFDELLKNYRWIKPDSRLGQKLQDRKLFKNDIKTVVSWFTPILPFLGLIEGGAVIVSEMMDNSDASDDYDNDTSKKDNNNNDNTTCSTSQGDQHYSSTTGGVQHDDDENN